MRELVSREMLSHQSDIEKLEFSRRYWSLMNDVEWKILLLERGEMDVL